MNTQNFLDALRKNPYQYDEALTFELSLKKKYEALSGESLLEDYLLPARIYEFCQTDLSEEDVRVLFFLNEYLYFGKRSGDELNQCFVSLLVAAASALTIKRHQYYSSEMMAKIKLASREDLQHLAENNSPLLSLLDSDKAVELCRPPNDNPVYVKSYIEEMTMREFCVFSHSYLKREQLMDCPIIKEKMAQDRDLSQLINILKIMEDYKNYLQKIKQDYPDKPNLIQKKQAERLEIVEGFLENYKNHSDINFIDAFKKDAKTVYLSCCNKQLNWLEKPFLERLADVLSIGVRPMYRSFFSPEANFIHRLKVEVEKFDGNIPLVAEGSTVDILKCN